jgi:hypothetical protein
MSCSQNNLNYFSWDVFVEEDDRRSYYDLEPEGGGWEFWCDLSFSTLTDRTIEEPDYTVEEYESGPDHSRLNQRPQRKFAHSSKRVWKPLKCPSRETPTLRHQQTLDLAKHRRTRIRRGLKKASAIEEDVSFDSPVYPEESNELWCECPFCMGYPRDELDVRRLAFLYKECYPRWLEQEHKRLGDGPDFHEEPVCLEDEINECQPESQSTCVVC